MSLWPGVVDTPPTGSSENFEACRKLIGSLPAVLSSPHSIGDGHHTHCTTSTSTIISTSSRRRRRRIRKTRGRQPLEHRLDIRANPSSLLLPLPLADCSTSGVDCDAAQQRALPRRLQAGRLAPPPAAAVPPQQRLQPVPVARPVAPRRAPIAIAARLDSAAPLRLVAAVAVDEREGCAVLRVRKCAVISFFREGGWEGSR